METITGLTFKEGLDHNRQAVSDFLLEDCTFDGSAGFIPRSSFSDPSLRPTIRNVVLRNTNALSAFLDGTIIEDVLVERTKGGKNPIFLRGNAYRHVTLRGRIAHAEIRGKMFPPLHLKETKQEEIKATWDAANAKYYETVDWALDITEAEFGSFSITGIPAKLIRRNPETTAVVTLERAMEGKWRKLAYSSGLFFVVISQLVDDGYDDVVLIACQRSQGFKDDLEDLQMLRDHGIAT